MDNVLDRLRLSDVMTFLDVCRAGSASAVARRLKVTPSQVTKAVARLEDIFGEELIRSSARGMTMTDAARRLFPRLEALTRGLQDLSAHKSPSSELTIAAPSYVLSSTLRALARLDPELRLRGAELPPEILSASIDDRLFDAAVVLGEVHRAPAIWTQVALGELRHGLFASPGLAAQLGPSTVAAERLTQIPFITPASWLVGPTIALDDRCPLGPSARRIGHEVDTIGVAVELAAATEQLVFGPYLAAEAHLGRGSLVEIVVEGWDVRSPLFLLGHKDRLSARRLREVSRALTEALTAGPPRSTRSR